MKQYIILLLSITVIATSCIKDRIQPVAAPVVASTGDTLMFYWDFNGSDTSIHTPSYGVNTPASFKYYANYIDYGIAGTPLNIYGAGDPTGGNGLRVRNPSDSVMFFMPTTGYDSIKFSFAVRASSTSSGSTQGALYYTIDGTNYISTGLSNNTYTVDTVYSVKSFDFSANAQVKHNPKFAVKLVFVNNHTGTSGNDRFDNVSLIGVRK